MRRKSVGPSVSFFAFQDVITSVVGIFVLVTLAMVLELVDQVENNMPLEKQVEGQFAETNAMLEAELQELRDEYQEALIRQQAEASVNSLNVESRLKAIEKQSQRVKQQMERYAALKVKSERLIANAKLRRDSLTLEQSHSEPRRLELAQLESMLTSINEHFKTLENEDAMIFREQLEGGRQIVLVELKEQWIQVIDSIDNKESRFHVGNRLTFTRWLDQLDLASRHFLILIKPSAIDAFDWIRKEFESRNANFGFDVIEESKLVRLRQQLEPSEKSP